MCQFGQNYGLGGAYYNCYLQPPLACAAAGGQPSATCPATTCAPAADCALATRCAENGVENCYGTDGHGPCAAEFAATTGSTDPATVLDRLKNGGDYASALLVALLESERREQLQVDLLSPAPRAVLAAPLVAAALRAVREDPVVQTREAEAERPLA